MQKENSKSKRSNIVFIGILLLSSLVVSFLVKNSTEQWGEEIIQELDSQEQQYVNDGRGVEWDTTLDEINQSIAEDPENADLYNQKGNKNLKNGEFREAVIAFDKAIQINPSYAEPYNGRGVAYRNLGEYNKAIQNYTKAIVLYPSFFEAYNNRGVAFLFLDNSGGACSDFEKACEFGSCQKLETAQRNGVCEG